MTAGTLWTPSYSRGLAQRPTPGLAICSEIAPRGSLRVGLMAAAHPSPFLVTLDRCTGEPSGVPSLLGQAVADALELPVEFIVHDRLGALDASARKSAFDLTFAPITDDREAVLAFSAPYFRFANTLLVPTSSHFVHVDEVDRRGMRIAALEGSVHCQLLTARLRHASLQTAPTLQQLAALLGSREVDAVAHAEPVLKTMARRMGDVRLLDGALSVTSLAAAVPKGRPGAWRYVSSFMAAAVRTGQVARAFSHAGLYPDGSA